MSGLAQRARCADRYTPQARPTRSMQPLALSVRAACSNVRAACSSSAPSKSSQRRACSSSTAAGEAGRRQALLASAAALVAAASATALPPAAQAAAAGPSGDFLRSQSGLLIEDISVGAGAQPQPGQRVVVNWSGYTKGYQAKRIDNTSTRDDPYEFTLGGSDTIAAFQEAVAGMRVGGIRRIEVPGDHPELSYPRDRSQRFTNELLPNAEGKVYRYRLGPQPFELGGQRALDFVLDNGTLQDFNRTLLFDIKLLAVRSSGR